MRFTTEDKPEDVMIELNITTTETVIREGKPTTHFKTTHITADVDQLENLIRILGDAARRASSIQATISFTDH